MIRRVLDPLLECESVDLGRTMSDSVERAPQDEIDLQKYWFILKRRWLPASIVFISVVVLAMLYALTRKPNYEAEARLLFQTSRAQSLTGLLREGQGSSSTVDSVGRLETLSRENNPLDTQAEILRSIPILQATITSLNLKNDKGNPIEPETLAMSLTVKGIPGTDILRISYQARDPEQASAIVNKLVDVFIQNNIQSNRAEPIAAREFIADQLPKTELAVREADQALREFKERHGILVLQEEASAAVTSIATLNDQISQTKAQLADISAQSRHLQSQIRTSPQQALLYASLSQSPGVQDVLNQLQQAQRELTIQQSRFVGGPPITKLEQKVVGLDALLKERIRQVAGNNQKVALGDLQIGDTRKELVVKLADIEAQRVGLVERLIVLSNTSNTYRERVRKIPALEKTQRELERRLDAAQKTYEALLSRLQAIQVAENQNIGNTRIIAKARTPKQPISSRKNLILGAAIFVGFLLAIATAFILDLIDCSIKTLKQAKEVFGYTLLGVIPIVSHLADKSSSLRVAPSSIPKVILKYSPYSPTTQAFQMLQASLKFLGSDKPLKAIAVTSSVAGEGKSFIAANLAATMAQSGQKVLLVDANMRYPIQHRIWDIVSLIGLSNVIVEQVPTNEAFHEVIPNLFLLSSGVIPSNPIALLDSNRMVTFMNNALKDFDFVVVDTPALAGNPDAGVLEKVVDGFLLVVCPGCLDISRAYAAKDFLSQVGLNIIGMVVNNLSNRNEPDSYFYYSDIQNESTYRNQSSVPFHSIKNDWI